MRFEDFKDLTKATFPEIDTTGWIDNQNLYESLLIYTSSPLTSASNMKEANLYSFFDMVRTQLHNINVTGNTIWDKPKQIKK
jgi:hypothetical protein